MSKVKFDCTIEKLEADQQIVYGWASVVEVDGAPVVDSQGDVISAAELEKAAHKFVTNCRVAGDMHLVKGVGQLVESLVFTNEIQKALGVDLKKVGWFVGFKVTDADVWKRIRKGELPMFSIGGKGVRTNAE